MFQLRTELLCGPSWKVVGEEVYASFYSRISRVPESGSCLRDQKRLVFPDQVKVPLQ